MLGSMRRSALLSCVLAALCACDEPSQATSVEGPEVRASETTAPPRTEASKAPELPPQLPRCDDPRYRDAATLFGRDEVAGAKALWLTLPESLDAELLGARIHAAEGDEVGAVRAIESARARHPGQGRVYATAAEIHCAGGRLSSAEDEIREGLGVAGPIPDLTRARGVLALCRQGGARAGLEHLLAAREADASLEFCERPLSQAHVLLGNAALAKPDPVQAAAHAQAALVALPGDLEARQLLGDAFAASGNFDEALPLYEELLAAGEPVQGTLATYYLNGATVALLAKDRPRALERYLRALALGLPREELGFGATVIAEAVAERVERGTAAYERGDLPGAREAFEAALAVDPHSTEALNHLGVVLFRSGDHSAAAERWKAVLEAAREQGLELPEPVHLNLARALYQCGRLDEVRSVLERYLSDSPDGEFAAETREMLARLDREKR
jgi:tetratricopeptide (TPR) repeat protein